MKRSKLISGFMFGRSLAVIEVWFYYLHNEWMAEPRAIGQVVAPVYVQAMNGHQLFTQLILLKKSDVIFSSVACLHCQKELNDRVKFAFAL
jgi:hypothetical protein